MWTYLFMGVVLLLLGFAVHILKMDMLIAGYNTMSKENKEKVDTESLSRFLGFYCYISGTFFLILGLIASIGYTVPETPVTAAFLIWTVIILISAQRFDGNTKRGQRYNERNQRSHKKSKKYRS
ncbi:hypothetical protein ADIAL_2141 [Alkalibacterium sp. AK22]|uniref:DUF3784 domain-containing protein n=1 Tax=Alkalibacterium sp. AK22 TaxID=1229520 RepID=UPI0004473D17|nr:DUF3784 domain-containing protein [Alkalibacterium sp. AK22]EXJ22555.1 hypothetical protein ADIAL_2141 [Alkalibacterium sp. AK22]